MAYYKHTIKMTFRNGKSFVIYANDFMMKKGPDSHYTRIWFHGKPQINIMSGSPNVFEEGEFYMYNLFPVKSNLFELFPDDWDQEDEQFNIIDELYVNSKGIERDE